MSTTFYGLLIALFPIQVEDWLSTKLADGKLKKQNGKVFLPIA